jgi:hypothetical protein
MYSFAVFIYRSDAFTLSAIIALMMEAASTSEMSVNFYQTTRRNNSEDSYLYTRRHKNLKSKKNRCFIKKFSVEFSS